MWFHRHQLFQIFSYSVTRVWICLFCHQLLQNLVGLVLGLCLHFVLNVKARSAVDFIHFGFVPTYTWVSFLLFLNLNNVRFQG